MFYIEFRLVVEVLKISQKRYPKLPIILCSGYIEGVRYEIDSDCMKLPKPFSKDDLITAVNKVLGASV